MKKIYMLIGAISTIFGILPFYFNYPFRYGPNSGPINGWELILMLAYQGQKWYLFGGIVLLIVSVLSYVKQHKSL